MRCTDDNEESPWPKDVAEDRVRFREDYARTFPRPLYPSLAPGYARPFAEMPPLKEAEHRDMKRRIGGGEEKQESKAAVATCTSTYASLRCCLRTLSCQPFEVFRRRLCTPIHSSESETSSPSNPPPAPADNPKDDIAYHNIRLLTQDLLIVIVLVRAISDADIGRIEVLLPHLTMMLRGSGCNKDIMRDNMIFCISGRGPGHCMGVDLNIEHLIGYLKIRTLLQAKGMNSTWDRLGNISAAILHLQYVKKPIVTALNSVHTSAGHTNLKPRTSY
ncbi:hypothetical protein K438DRAFT_1937848 [Mycena galopus ATCC 62051]|nr:hypothetical protein K438DRAFT_1937848 [Mycena galopus ATCC 62051]